MPYTIINEQVTDGDLKAMVLPPQPLPSPSGPPPPSATVPQPTRVTATAAPGPGLMPHPSSTLTAGTSSGFSVSAIQQMSAQTGGGMTGPGSHSPQVPGTSPLHHMGVNPTASIGSTGPLTIPQFNLRSSPAATVAGGGTPLIGGGTATPLWTTPLSSMGTTPLSTALNTGRSAPVNAVAGTVSSGTVPLRSFPIGGPAHQGINTNHPSAINVPTGPVVQRTTPPSYTTVPPAAGTTVPSVGGGTSIPSRGPNPVLPPHSVPASNPTMRMMSIPVPLMSSTPQVTQPPLASQQQHAARQVSHPITQVVTQPRPQPPPPTTATSRGPTSVPLLRQDTEVHIQCIMN